MTNVYHVLERKLLKHIDAKKDGSGVILNCSMSISEKYCRIGEVNLSNELCVSINMKGTAARHHEGLCQKRGMELLKPMTASMNDELKSWLARNGGDGKLIKENIFIII